MVFVEAGKFRFGTDKPFIPPVCLWTYVREAYTSTAQQKPQYC